MASSRARLRPVIVVLGLCLLPALQIGADGLQGPLVDAQRFELANGMRFVVVERPRPITVAAGWLVETGTAHDPPGRTGMAHSLEHLLFQGTETLAPGELDSLYAAAGATGLNAMTRRDFTAYFVALPAEKLELWFWLESDRLRDARFRDLSSERAAILEERRLRIDAAPGGRIEERATSAFWGSHPYGRPNAGRPDQLEDLSLKEVRRHFARHYRPERLVAVLVGPVTAADVRPLAELYFGRLEAARPAGEPGVEIPPFRPSEATPASPLVGRCDCRPRVQLSYPAPGFPDPDAVVAETLVAVLNGRSGRLHRSLVLRGESAFAAYARLTPLRHAGRLTLIAEAHDDGDLEDLARRLEAEAARLGSEPIGTSELTTAKNRLAANTLRRLEEPSELLLELLIHHGLGRGDRLDAWAAELAAVTPEEVRRLAERIFRPEHQRRTFFVRRQPTGEIGP